MLVSKIDSKHIAKVFGFNTKKEFEENTGFTFHVFKYRSFTEIYINFNDIYYKHNTRESFFTIANDVDLEDSKLKSIIETKMKAKRKKIKFLDDMKKIIKDKFKQFISDSFSIPIKDINEKNIIISGGILQILGNSNYFYYRIIQKDKKVIIDNKIYNTTYKEAFEKLDEMYIAIYGKSINKIFKNNL